MSTFTRASLAIVFSALLVSCGGGKVSDNDSTASASQSKRKAAAGSTQEALAPTLTATWTQLPNPNYAPPAGPYARAWTEMTWDSKRQEVVIFGGNGATGYENDIWAYNHSTTNWTEIDPNVICPGNSGFSKPNGTDDSNFKYDPVNNLYWVFGVNSGYRCLSHTPTRTADAGSQGATLVDNDLSSVETGTYTRWKVLIGGQAINVLGYDGPSKTLTLEQAVPGLSNGTNYQLYAHTGAGIWYFNPVDRKWIGQNTPAGDIGPIPTGARISPGVAYSDKDEAFILFGGKASGLIDKQIWRLDVRTKLWTQLPPPPTGTPPHMRGLLNSLVYDKQNDVFVLFGGICYNDPSCTDSTHLGQTWVYHLPSNTWTNMNPPNGPSARSKHVMTYDEEHGVITLFGGLTNNGAADDTWVYHYPSNSWSKLSPSASPVPRYLAQVAYDPILKRSVLFGGQAPTGMRADIWALKLSAVVNALPSVAVSSPGEGTSFTAPANITLSANASDSDGSIALLEFFIGGLKAGEVTTAPFTLNLPNLAAGQYVVTAKATDNRGGSTVSSPVNFTVQAPINQAPTVSLSSPSSGSNYTAPASISFSASASDADGSISKVEYYQGNSKIGEATAAPYAFVWSNVAAGSYNVKARATDNAGATTESQTVNVTVTPPVNQPPSVSLTSPASNSNFTSPASIQLTASTSDSDGSVVKVEYFAGASKLGESTTAPFSLTWASAPAGNYSLTARATDNSGASSTSAAVAISVTEASGGNAINVALASNGGVATASSSHSASFPVRAINDGNRKGDKWASGGGWNDASQDAYPDWAQVNFNGVKTINRIDVFTLADNYASTTEPTQSLVFTKFGITKFLVQYWNGTAWITVQGGDVSGNNLVWRSFVFPAVSTDRVRVLVTESLYSYSRIVELEAWSSASANEAPSVSLSSPTPGSIFTAPASISLTSSASDRDGSIAKVEYFQGNTKIGEATAEPYRLLWNNVPAGTYTLTAKATDNAGAVTTSAAIGITVNPAPNQLPTISLLTPANGASYTAPASIALSASASDPDGSVTKVEYFVGTTRIGQANVAPYNLAWNNVAAGSYRLTAKATDNSGAVTESVAINITVNVPPNQAPSVTIASPSSGSNYTAPASINLSASASDADGSVARVEYFHGSTKIGEASGAPFNVQWSNVTAGSYTVTAKATDNLGASSVSVAISVSVSTPPPSPSINVARATNGGIATASSSHSAAFPVRSIIDGSRTANNWANGGGWNDATQSVYPDWVQVNFDAVKTIDRVVLVTLADNFSAGTEPTPAATFSKYGVTDFQVQYWNGSSWLAVPGGSVSANNLVMKTISFPALSTDRIRVVITGSLYWYSRIVELEAWSSTGP